MPRILVPLPDIQLDPRNTEALLSSIQTKIYLESNGALNDFSSASPLSALTEGQAYAQSELLYYLNNLPEAFVLQWLKLMGIQRIVGSHSYAELLFIRQPGYARSVVVPEGTEFFSGSGLKFVLLETVEISTDEPVLGVVRSDKWGSIYNVPANSILRATTPIQGLSSFYNPQPASGGESQESVGEMKSRALTTLSRRSLTTKLDYQQEIQTLFPELESVEVFTYEDLSPFIDNLAPGYVYICYGNQSETLFRSEYISAEILRSLRLKSPLGTEISILDPIYNRLRIDVSLEYSSSAINNIDSLSNQIYQDLINSVSFINKPLGSSFSYNEVISILNQYSDSINLNLVSVGSLKLYADDIEPTFGQGCSDEYETIIDEDGICTPDYNWVLDQESTGIYVPTPIDLYTIYEVNISMTNSENANTTTFTYKNV